MAQESLPTGVTRLKGIHKALVALTVLCGVVAVFFVFFSRQGIFQIYQLRQERQRLELENARLAQENERLARTIDRLYHDPAMIQDLIRRELNFVRKNEIIIQFPDSTQPVALPPAKEPPSRESERKGQPQSRPKVRAKAGSTPP